MEKNKGGQSAYDVWIYEMPGEGALSGATCNVRMMRRLREQGADSLVAAESATLKILNVTPRRKSGTISPDSTRRELALEVEVVEGVGRSVTNHFDDGRGLSAFQAGVKFDAVYWPSDKMARVRRDSEVLR